MNRIAEAERDRLAAIAYNANRRHRQARFDLATAYEAEQAAQHESDEAHADYTRACRRLADVLAEALKKKGGA